MLFVLFVSLSACVASGTGVGCIRCCYLCLLLFVLVLMALLLVLRLFALVAVVGVVVAIGVDVRGCAVFFLLVVKVYVNDVVGVDKACCGCL